MIHKTVLHFGKSVLNLFRGISHSKVIADLAECPTAVWFYLGWQWWDEEKEKSLHRQRDTSPALWSLQGLMETPFIPRGQTPSHSSLPPSLSSPPLLPVSWVFCFFLKNSDSNLLFCSHWYYPRPGSLYLMPQLLQPSLNTHPCLLSVLTNPFHVKLPRMFLLHSAFICWLRWWVSEICSSLSVQTNISHSSILSSLSIVLQISI